MGTNRVRLARQGRRSRAHGDRQSLVCRSSPLDRPHGLPVARFAERVRPMAYGVHALLPVASQRRVGTRGARRVRRDGDQTCADRLDHRTCAPAFGRRSKKSGPQALGRSRGGLTTKLHLAVDEAGRPLRMIVTEGQVSDISCAHELVEHLRTGAVIADKGYDSDAFVNTIRATRAKAVIPPRSNRKTKRRYSRVLYRTRNIVERFFNRIKHFRRVSTRYDKLAGNYLAFAVLACAFGPLVRM
ncbi:transposase DDE domain protein [Burkholderia pseudomallei]|nr:transposase DDE domain protein [Burkholderia pseudomallei]